LLKSNAASGIFSPTTSIRSGTSPRARSPGVDYRAATKVVADRDVAVIRLQ
jgi:hypothetical protein